MNLAISNLAWDFVENEGVIKLLQEKNVTFIEVAISKILDGNYQNYKTLFNKNGIKIIATTSLLYGHPELTLFENQETRKKTLAHLKKQAKIANEMGAKTMMFGSPKNRIKGNLSDNEAQEITSEFFNLLCDYTKKFGISIAFEPNPPIYGGDFILTTNEAINLTKKINHEYFGVNLDSGTIASNKENCAEIIKRALPFVKHAHISEPFLKPIPDGKTDHQVFANALKENRYEKFLSIEMPLGQEIDHLKQIEKTLNFVVSTYL